MKNKMSASMFQKEQVIESIRQSFVKLNPRMMIKNPIMFYGRSGYRYYAGGNVTLSLHSGIWYFRI